MGRTSMPAPRTGSSAGTNTLRIAGLRLILVHAPAAFHHRGQNLCFLLICGGQIIARNLIAGIFPQALAAFLYEGVQCREILAEGSVYRRNLGTANTDLLQGAEA